MDELGTWAAYGAGASDGDEATAECCDMELQRQMEDCDRGEQLAHLWIEADVPTPKTETIKGEPIRQ